MDSSEKDSFYSVWNSDGLITTIQLLTCGTGLRGSVVSERETSRDARNQNGSGTSWIAPHRKSNNHCSRTGHRRSSISPPISGAECTRDVFTKDTYCLDCVDFEKPLESALVRRDSGQASLPAEQVSIQTYHGSFDAQESALWCSNRAYLSWRWSRCLATVQR